MFNLAATIRKNQAAIEAAKAKKKHGVFAEEYLRQKAPEIMRFLIRRLQNKEEAWYWEDHDVISADENLRRLLEDELKKLAPPTMEVACILRDTGEWTPRNWICVVTKRIA